MGIRLLIPQQNLAEPVPEKDPTDTKPVYLPISRPNDERLNDPSPEENTLEVSQNNKDLDTPSIPREKPLIVIPEPGSVIASPPAEQPTHPNPQQTKNLFTSQ